MPFVFCNSPSTDAASITSASFVAGSELSVDSGMAQDEAVKISLDTTVR